MQVNLFDDGKDTDRSIEHDLHGTQLREYPHAFTPSEASTLLDTLIADIPWKQEQLWIAGQLRTVPRLQCWMGNEASYYGYSGAPFPWNSTVNDIHRRVQQLIELKFNSAILNYYRDAQDSIAWHADDELELQQPRINLRSL